MTGVKAEWPPLRMAISVIRLPESVKMYNARLTASAILKQTDL